MSQYTDRSKLPVLLRGPNKERAGVRVANGMAEIVMENGRAVVPLMETVNKLNAKLTAMEQRLSNLENRLNRHNRSE